MKNYDIVVVGGGIAGLTATAYGLYYGYRTALFEYQDKVGGVVSTFNVGGYTFDGGPRSIENSGTVKPMLEQLGLHLEWSKSPVSMIVENQTIILDQEEDIQKYENLLISLFPESIDSIKDIISDISKFMDYSKVLYGVNNPLFIDLKKQPKSFYTKELFPWLFQFLKTSGKINRLKTPIEDYLQMKTDNQDLIKFISEHFFQNTPVFFALSYFSIYIDYFYPKGGTGELAKILEKYILQHQGNIYYRTQIKSIDIEHNVIKTENEMFQYRGLVWAGSIDCLYSSIDLSTIQSIKLQKRINDQKEKLSSLQGGDSVIQLFLGVNLPNEYFRLKHTGHVFYTTKKKDLILLKEFISNAKKTDSIDEKLNIIESYLRSTTYEISVPSLKDRSYEESSLEISTLMDYSVVEDSIRNQWYDALKERVKTVIIDVLDQSLYPGISQHIKLSFLSTPYTIKDRFLSKDGAITGFAFSKDNPSETNVLKVANSVKSNIKNIVTAGQWTYSPAGVPTAVMTGKLAVDYLKKTLKIKKQKSHTL